MGSEMCIRDRAMPFFIMLGDTRASMWRESSCFASLPRARLARCGIGQGNRFGAAGGWGHALVEGLNEVVDLRGRKRGLTSCFLHRVGIPDSFGRQGCHDQPF